MNEPDEFDGIDPEDEPIGECDECGADLYPTDPDDALCGRCSVQAELDRADDDEEEEP